VSDRLAGRRIVQRQTGEASSYHNAVVYLACFRGSRRRLLIPAIAHRMRVLDHCFGIAGSGLLVALAGISVQPELISSVP